MAKPRDDAPAIEGAFGVDDDPFTDDDSIGQGCSEPDPDPGDQ